MIKQGVRLLVGCLIALSLCSCTRDIALSNESGESTRTEFITNKSAAFDSSVDSTATSQSIEVSTTLSKAEITTSKKPTTATTQKTTTKATVNPLDVPLVFDDALVEKLVRDFVDKPNGDVYPRDFSDFINGGRYFEIRYTEETNKTSFLDWVGVGNTSEVNGKPTSFKALSTIPFKYIHLENISDIKYFCSDTLESIRLFNNGKTENFKSLTNSKNLKSLFVDGCKGVDLSLLSGLQNIEGITIKESEASGFEVIASFKKLKYLEMYHSSFTNLSPLRNHPSLESLSFDYVADMDLSSLLTIPKLKSLTVGDLERVGYYAQFPSQTIYQELTQKGVTIKCYAKDGWS